MLGRLAPHPQGALMKVTALALAALLTAATTAASAIDTYDLGGSALGDPSTVWYKFGGKDVVAVFVRGSDGHLYAQVGDGNGGGWTGWAPIGSELLKSDPACVATSTSLIDCVAVGKNSNVFHVRYNAKKHEWTKWENLGGFATGAPGVARTSADGATALNVFVSGPENTLFINTYDGSWSDWKSLGVKVGGTVACTDILVLGAHCYDAGANGAEQFSDLTRTSGDEIFVDHLGGAIAGKVSAVATGMNGDTLRVFVNGPGKRLWFKKWDGGWQDWEQLPVTVGSSPGCAMRKAGGDAWCASVEANGTVKMIRIGEDEI